MHRDVTFMLQDLIPDVTSPYTDNIPVKGPKMRYGMGSGGYEVLAENLESKIFSGSTCRI